MRIAIYDSEHVETTFTLVKALAIPGNQLTLFVTEEVAAELQQLLSEKETAAFDWTILQRAKMTNLITLFRQCRNKQIQVLLLNTVSYHHLLFGVLCLLLRKTKTILTIHDANSFFKPAFSLKLRGIVKYAGKKLLATSVNGFSTLLKTTKEYIEHSFYPAVPVGCVPGSFFASSTIPYLSVETTIILAIPGSVDTKRRNYEPLYELAKLWISQSKKLEIVLLGGAKDASGQTFLQKLKQLSTNQLVFSVYEQPFIDQKEYDYQLQRCHFVYAPLQKMFAEESIIPEQYGLTKSSGCFFDAIRFGKPLLLPAAIHLPDELAQQTILHSTTAELTSFLSSLTKEKLAHLHTAAYHNSTKFSLEKISQQLSSFLHKLS